MVNDHTPFEQWNWRWSNNVSSKSTPTMSEMFWKEGGGRRFTVWKFQEFTLDLFGKFFVKLPDNYID